MDKNLIRKEVLTRRCNLNKQDISILTDKIICNLKKTQFFKSFNPEGKKISLFSSFKGEPDLSGLRDYFLDKNASCYYPVTLREDILMAEYNHILTPGALGIPEPSRSEAIYDKMDVVFIPGLAFDTYGNRIGFGKGYYDRYLSLHKSDLKPYVIALAYDFQVYEKIPADKSDIPVDMIVTESRTIIISNE